MRVLQNIARALAGLALAALLGGPAAAAEVASAGRVFLTFDDGPINATLDVLDVLKAQHVKATFFINANHLDGRGGEHEDRAQEALRRVILEGHVLGNHSYDHMGHNQPPGTHAVVATEAYRDVETDLRYFLSANQTPVVVSLGPLAKRPNNRIATLARLPYSNVWMLARLGALCGWCGTETGPFWHPDARANAEREVSAPAGSLAAALYQDYHMESIGWDLQWKPGDWTRPDSNETMSPAAAIEAEIVALLKAEHACSQAAAPCKAPVRRHNVIVLLHDFLFENGSRGRGKDHNLPELIKLISALKAQGYTFDTLDHYAD